jgi:hypothetical protein
MNSKNYWPPVVSFMQKGDCFCYNALKKRRFTAGHFLNQHKEVEIKKTKSFLASATGGFG